MALPTTMACDLTRDANTAAYEQSLTDPDTSWRTAAEQVEWITPRRRSSTGPRRDRGASVLETLEPVLRPPT